jgi:toxin ParE1/3/4
VKVVVEDGAIADLMESVAWYERQEKGIGQRFLDDVDATLRKVPNLVLRSLKASRVPHAMFVSVRGPWPYRLVVIERGDTRFVVAVAHDRRRPDYWAER